MGIMITGRAYLIAICDPETNAIKGAAIWSSPEWEQSMMLEDYTYVAWQVDTTIRSGTGAPFHAAAKHLLESIVHHYTVIPSAKHNFRYRKLLAFLRKEFNNFGLTPHPDMEFHD